MKRILGVFFVFCLLASCGTYMQVQPLNAEGKYETMLNAKAVEGVRVDMDTLKSLLLVPANPYFVEMISQLGYFDKVQTVEDYEIEMIKAGKGDEIGDLLGKVSLNKACRKYKKFLYLKFDENPEKNNMVQIQLIDPLSFEKIFVAEVKVMRGYSGVTDQQIWHPLFNSFILFLRTSSEKYL